MGQQEIDIERVASPELEEPKKASAVEDLYTVYEAEEGMARGLKQRHIQMIAFSGTIGTGLFLSSGFALSSAGPVGMLLGYLVVSGLVICTQLCLAEVSTLMPVTGAYIRHAGYLTDRAMAFASGWTLGYGSLVSSPGEIIACQVLVSYWTDVNPAVFVTVFIVLTSAVNLSKIRIFGEIEFVAAILKLLLVIGLILVCLIIDVGGVSGQARLGFHYWRDPGPFAEYLTSGNLGKFAGFWSVFSSAVYSFSGIESVTLAAGETDKPRQNIPKACKRVFFRVVFCYLFSLFFMSLVVPYTDHQIIQDSGTASSSAFVVAIERAGIKALPSIVNAGVLISAWSATNQGVLSGTRAIFGLASLGLAPKLFTKKSRHGIPINAALLNIAFLLLAYMTVNNAAASVFWWFQNLTAASVLLVWFTVGFNHIRLRMAMKAQGIPRSRLPWSTPITYGCAWVLVVSCWLLLLTGGFAVFVHGNWSTSDFCASYLNPMLYVTVFVSWKLIGRTHWKKLSEVDLDSLFRYIDDHPEEPIKKATGWRRLNFFWG